MPAEFGLSPSSLLFAFEEALVVGALFLGPTVPSDGCLTSDDCRSGLDVSRQPEKMTQDEEMINKTVGIETEEPNN